MLCCCGVTACVVRALRLFLLSIQSTLFCSFPSFHYMPSQYIFTLNVYGSKQNFDFSSYRLDVHSTSPFLAFSFFFHRLTQLFPFLSFFNRNCDSSLFPYLSLLLLSLILFCPPSRSIFTFFFLLFSFLVCLRSLSSTPPSHVRTSPCDVTRVVRSAALCSSCDRGVGCTRHAVFVCRTANALFSNFY